MYREWLLHGHPSLVMQPKYTTFTFIHLVDAFIQSDLQERALQSAQALIITR